MTNEVHGERPEEFIQDTVQGPGKYIQDKWRKASLESASRTDTFLEENINLISGQLSTESVQECAYITTKLDVGSESRNLKIFKELMELDPGETTASNLNPWVLNNPLSTILFLDPSRPNPPIPEAIRQRIERGESKISDWEDRFEAAELRSPGAQLAELAKRDPDKAEKMQRDEWLVRDPLTGICTGLACDFILQMEKGVLDPNNPEMQPSSNARYFERLLIPAMLTVCRSNGVTPGQIKLGERRDLVDQVYQLMMQSVHSSTGLDVELVKQHESLESFLTELDGLPTEGHHILILEDEQGGVAANHSVYFNPEQRIIGDGSDGMVLKVEEGEDFNAVLALYVKSRYSNTCFTKFSVANVTRQEGVDLSSPSRFQRFKLKAEILALKIMFTARQAFSSLRKSDRPATKIVSRSISMINVK